MGTHVLLGDNLGPIAFEAMACFKGWSEDKSRFRVEVIVNIRSIFIYIYIRCFSFSLS